MGNQIALYFVITMFLWGVVVVGGLILRVHSIVLKFKSKQKVSNKDWIILGFYLLLLGVLVLELIRI